MFYIFKLILPTIIPSWRFFDVIAPSPRIEYVLLDKNNKLLTEWCEFRPRPQSLSFFSMLARMLWNVRWNENLFMISCAERIFENSPTQYLSELEILKRIRKSLLCDSDVLAVENIQFHLILLEKNNNKIDQSIFFESRIAPLILTAKK